MRARRDSSAAVAICVHASDFNGGSATTDAPAGGSTVLGVKEPHPGVMAASAPRQAMRSKAGRKRRAQAFHQFGHYNWQASAAVSTNAALSMSFHFALAAARRASDERRRQPAP